MSGDDGRFAACLADVESGTASRALAAIPRLAALGDERARRVLLALSRDRDPLLSARARSSLAALDRVAAAFDETPAPRYLAARVGSAAALADEAVFLYRRHAARLVPLALLWGIPELLLWGNFAGWILLGREIVPAPLALTVFALLFILHTVAFRPLVWLRLSEPLLPALGARPFATYGDLLPASLACAAFLLLPAPFAVWYATIGPHDGMVYLALSGGAIAALIAYSASCLIFPRAIRLGDSPLDTFAALSGGDLFRVVNHVATPFLLFLFALLLAFAAGGAETARHFSGGASGMRYGEGTYLLFASLGVSTGRILLAPFWIAYHLLLDRAAEGRP